MRDDHFGDAHGDLPPDSTRSVLVGDDGDVVVNKRHSELLTAPSASSRLARRRLGGGDDDGARDGANGDDEGDEDDDDGPSHSGMFTCFAFRCNYCMSGANSNM